jgi:hypothetical protein
MTMGQGLKLQRCEIESEYYNNDELRNNKNQWSMGRIYYGSDESEREKRGELMEAFLAGWRGRDVYFKQRKGRV